PRPAIERTASFLPSTASTWTRRKVSLCPPPIPRNPFLFDSPATAPVTVAPLAMTVLSPILSPSLTVKLNPIPSGASAGTSCPRIITNGKASLTETGVVWIAGARGGGFGAGATGAGGLTAGGMTAAGAGVGAIGGGVFALVVSDTFGLGLRIGLASFGGGVVSAGGGGCGVVAA